MRVTYYYPWGFFHPVRSGAALVAERHLDYFHRRKMSVRVMLCGGHDIGKRRAFEKRHAWLDDLLVVDPRRYPVTSPFVERYDLANYLALHSALGSVPECRSFLSQPADLAFVNYVFATPLLDFVPTTARRILETYDIMSKQFAVRHGKPALKSHDLRAEFDLYEAYDCVLMINRDEYDLARVRGNARLAYVARSIESVDEDDCLEDANEVLYDLLFVGSDYGPNVEGITYFHKHVFRPLLRRHGLRMAVAGRVCNHLNIVDDAVESFGTVDDLGALYRRAKVVVVPLFTGTGISIKTLEAMGRGKPIVTTPIGMRGLSDAHDRVFEMPFEEEPEKVARCIRDLCASQALREQYGRKGLEYVRANYGREGYESRMDQIVEQTPQRVPVSEPSARRFEPLAA